MVSSERVQQACLMTNLTTGEPTHVDPASVPVLNHLDFLCRVVLPGEATAGSISVIEQRARLGCMTPRHVHAREAETFIVLDGALEGWCEGQVRLVEAGQLIHLPANREHAYRVASDRAHYYLLLTPAGLEAFFLETGTVVDQPFEGELPIPGPVSQEKVNELVAALTPLGASITGPPPFDAT
jgi:quercetin dioxygenase-like cupin family protein